MAAVANDIVLEFKTPEYSDLFVSAELDEDLLAAAYLRMKVEGILPIVYHESVPPLSEFLSYHNRKQSGYHYLGAFVRPRVDVAPELVGMGWLWNVMGNPGARKGEVGMVFFKDWQKPAVTTKAMRLMIDYCFDGAGCDIIIGTTPVKNRAALIFDRRLGFTQLQPAVPNFCTFQGEPCDAVVSFLTKESWRS